MGFSKNDIKSILSPITSQLGVLCRKIGLLSDNSSDTNTLLEDIKTILASQQNSVDPVLYCDEDCNITGATGFLVDPDTLIPTPVYFDETLQPTDVPPTGAPCGPQCQQDFEFKTLGPICFTDENNNTVQQFICKTFINGVEESTTNIWVLADGTTTDTLPTGLTSCVEECDPAVESFLGDNATLVNFNSMELFIPKCCEVTVNTSAGSFTLPAQSQKWFYCKEFGCNITEYEIVADCTDDITTILTRTK